MQTTTPQNVNKPDQTDSVQNERSENTCLHCKKTFDSEIEEYSIQCGDCKGWLHYFCTEESPIQLMIYAHSKKKFTCASCGQAKYKDKVEEDWLANATAAILKQKLLISKTGTIPKFPRFRHRPRSHSPKSTNASRSRSLDDHISLDLISLFTFSHLKNSDADAHIGLDLTVNKNQSIEAPQNQVVTTCQAPKANPGNTNQLTLGLGSQPANLDLSLVARANPTPTQPTPQKDNAHHTPPTEPPPTPPNEWQALTQTVSQRTQNQSPPQQQRTNSETARRKQNAICYFYEQGNCRHGRSGRDCEYRHPRPCRRLIEHGPTSNLGCRLGTQCNNFHPLLCYDSVTKRECLNRECPLPHILGTRRYRRYRADNTKRTQTQSSSPNKNNKYSRNTTTRPAADRQPTKVAPTAQPASGNPQAFLDYMRGIQTTIDSLTKTVSAQGIMLSNAMGRASPGWGLDSLKPPQAYPSPFLPQWLTGPTIQAH